VGQTGSDASAAPLAIKLAPDGASCTFSFAPPPGAATAVTVSGESVLVAGALAGAPMLWRFEDSACQPPACACAPAVISPPLAVPEASVARATGVLVAGERVLVAGAAERADGSAYGFVLSASLATLVLEETELYDLTPEGDAILALASDTERFYFGGVRGADPGGGAGTAIFGELALPLGGGPSWLREVGGASAVTALGADPGGGGTLYLGTVGGGGVVRCDKLGACKD
jgi:hypothetical protein